MPLDGDRKWHHTPSCGVKNMWQCRAFFTGPVMGLQWAHIMMAVRTGLTLLATLIVNVFLLCLSQHFFLFVFFGPVMSFIIFLSCCTFHFIFILCLSCHFCLMTFFCHFCLVASFTLFSSCHTILFSSCYVSLCCFRQSICTWLIPTSEVRTDGWTNWQGIC